MSLSIITSYRPSFGGFGAGGFGESVDKKSCEVIKFSADYHNVEENGITKVETTTAKVISSLSQLYIMVQAQCIAHWQKAVSTLAVVVP